MSELQDKEEIDEPACDDCRYYSHAAEECHRVAPPVRMERNGRCDNHRSYTEGELSVIEQLQKSVSTLDEKLDSIEAIVNVIDRKMSDHLIEHKTADQSLARLDEIVRGRDGLVSKVQRLEDQKMTETDTKRQVTLGWQGWLMLVLVLGGTLGSLILAAVAVITLRK
jgi:hypothetical protein